MRIVSGIMIAVAAWIQLAGCGNIPVTSSVEFKTQAEEYPFRHGGYERHYQVYCPKACLTGKKVPLLMALHGGGGSAKRWPRYTNNGFERLAEQELFILVYPDGLKHQWNDGRNYSRSFAHKNNIDDLGFLSALIDRLLTDYPIDPERVYLTGASNGGIMSHYMAARYSGKIAAIAPVIGSISQKMLPTFHPTEPVSVLMINGKEDPLVKWEGGMIEMGGRQNGYVIPVEQAVQFWVRHNHCNATPVTVELPDRDPTDGTRVTETVYSGGQQGSEVVLVAITGGGHEWPAYQDKRGHFIKSVMDRAVGVRSRDIDACEVIWSFFKNHRKQKKQ